MSEKNNKSQFTSHIDRMSDTNKNVKCVDQEAHQWKIAKKRSTEQLYDLKSLSFMFFNHSIFYFSILTF